MLTDTTTMYLQTLASAAATSLAKCTPDLVKWNYETGVLLFSLSEASKQVFCGLLDGSVRERLSALILPDGEIRGYSLEEFNLDQINAGKLLLREWETSSAGKKANDQEKDLKARAPGCQSNHGFWATQCVNHSDSLSYRERLEKAIQTLVEQLSGQPRTAAGSYWHKKIYPYQVWLDGLYMFGPFQVHYGVLFDRADMIDDLCQQFLAVRDKLKHKETGLYFHAMDDSRASRWADPETGCSPHVWARAVGWLAMALVDALDWIPVAHSKRPYIEEMLVDLLDALVRAQCSSGLWLQVMDAPEAEGNYEETSASAMFAYALYKSLRKDLTADENSAKRWKKTADSALAVLITKKVRWECASEPSIQLPTRESITELSTGQSTMPRLHLDGICSVAGLGGSPYRDGSIDYYVGEPIVSDDFKGLGPFMLALTEALCLNQIILS